jgi:cytochrome P450 family 142 subfamily A polypeptide 1
MNVDVNFLDAAAWDEQMPERTRWLRANDPVFWSEKSRVWVITKYADVVTVSKNQELFTSADGVRAGQNVRIGLIDEGEPRHTQLRNLINKGFTPRMVRKLEDPFQRATTDVLDAVARLGVCDFVDDIAVPLPLIMIAEMIGVRQQDRGRFHHWSDAMIAADGNYGDPAIMAAATTAFTEYSAYVTEIIEARRRAPQDDLISILTGADDQGLLRRFDQGEFPGGTVPESIDLANSELLLLLVILMVAGNETTRNGMSGGMQLLIENPAQRAKLLADPALVPSAVEEMLRLISPVLSFSRKVTRDTALRGKTLRGGDQVLMLYGSANRDEEVFEDAEAFRVERNPQHLAFGIGTHFCLGANLARMEMRTLFEHVLRRLPDVEYATTGPLMRPSALVRSCVEMQVRYTPERDPARASA